MKIAEENSENLEQVKEKIGELLVKHAALTRPQLEEALETQMRSSLFSARSF